MRPSKEKNSKFYNPDIFLRNLERYMASKNVRPADVARAINISQCSISDWFGKRNFPSIGNLGALAQYFGVRLSELLEDEPMVVDRLSLDQQNMLDLYIKITEEEQDMILRLLRFLVDDRLSEEEDAVLSVYDELTDDKKELAIRMLHTLK